MIYFLNFLRASVLCFLIVGFSHTINSQAFAQGAVQQYEDEEEQDSSSLNYNEIPDKFIFEAKQVLSACNGSVNLRAYYDCDCYGLKYLETRVLLGEAATESEIRYKIRKECRDATEAAGIEYDVCISGVDSMTNDLDPGEYCECVANTYAQSLADRPNLVIQTRTLMPLKTGARTKCRKELLKKAQ